MRKIAIVLTGLACAGHGRRVKIFQEPLRRGLACSGTGCNRSKFNPLQLLATRFLAFNPAAGSNDLASNTQMRFASGSPLQTGRHLPFSKRQSRVGHRLIAMRGGEAENKTLENVDGSSRLLALRKQMAAANVQALVVPSGDPHLSEYVHPAYGRRAFISGFTGSAGTALVTEDKALLWTDGRYFLQAEQELSAEWTLMRMQQPGVPKLEDWVAEHLPAEARLGIDPFVHSVDDASKLQTALEAAKRGLSLVPLSGSPNLVDLVWSSDRPGLPQSLARLLPLDISGKSLSEKLAEVGKVLAEKSASGLLVGSLDEVCWLLNLRGADVPHCPVLQAYVLVHHQGSTSNEGEKNHAAPTTATLFVDGVKVSDDLRTELLASGVKLAPYEDIEDAVRAVDTSGGVLMLDPERVNYGLRLAAGDNALLAPSPITLPKAIKNDAEIAGMLEAHLVDGAAVAKFFAWLRRVVVDEKLPQTEVQIAKKIAEFRAEQEGFLDLSFPTIAGVGPNGAIIHYDPCSADEGKVRSLDDSEMLLLDSGGQYMFGTTDVTRTIHLGEPTAWQRECFTRVLKGNIALDTLVFPEDTPGMAVDSFARSSLWTAGLDYLHGTGHGVGAALNVHEGPQSISARWGNTHGLKEGMILSNEPGYYEQGKFGIRIENLLVVRKKATPNSFNGKKFLGFEQLTHIPICSSLIDMSLLTAAEVEWVDSYHSRVWERISPRLPKDSEGHVWLRDSTRPLAQQLRDHPSPTVPAEPAAVGA